MVNPRLRKVDAHGHTVYPKSEWVISHYTGLRIATYPREGGLAELCEHFDCPEDFYITEWLDDEIIWQMNADEYMRNGAP